MKSISATIILMTIVAGSAADERSAVRTHRARAAWRVLVLARDRWQAMLFIRTSGAMPAKSAFTIPRQQTLGAHCRR